jgi:hypothetical protein
MTVTAAAVTAWIFAASMVLAIVFVAWWVVLVPVAFAVGMACERDSRNHYERRFLR